VDKQLPPTLANLNTRLHVTISALISPLTIITRNLQAFDAVSAALKDPTNDDSHCACLRHMRLFHPTDLSSDISTATLP
jgi:hypothetical protein